MTMRPLKRARPCVFLRVLDEVDYFVDSERGGP